MCYLLVITNVMKGVNIKIFRFIGWTGSLHIQFNEVYELCSITDKLKITRLIRDCVVYFELVFKAMMRSGFVFITLELPHIIWSSSKWRASYL